MHYVAGWDCAESSMAITTGGAVTGTRTISTGTFAHQSMTSVMGTNNYSAFATRVQTALNDIGSLWTVTWNATTLQYTISCISNFTLTFTGDAGTRMRQALGFIGNVTSTLSATSNTRPYYVIRPAIAGRSKFTDVYEPDEIVEEAVSDGGTSYAVAKQTTELWCDWTQSMESVDATLARRAWHPWTWEHFVKHCRGTHPFAVINDGPSDNVYKLRAESASFNSNVRTRVTSDWDELWNISLRCRDLGVL